MKNSIIFKGLMLLTLLTSCTKGSNTSSSYNHSSSSHVNSSGTSDNNSNSTNSTNSSNSSNSSNIIINNEVNEDVWQSAILLANDKNLTIATEEKTYELDNQNNLVLSHEYDSIYKFTETRMMEYWKDEDYLNYYYEDMYEEDSDFKYYYSIREDGLFDKILYNEPVYTAYNVVNNFLGIEVSNYYDLVEYNEEGKYYSFDKSDLLIIYKEMYGEDYIEDYITCEYINLYFEKDKLIKVELKENYDGHEYYLSGSLYDYDKTVIDLPTNIYVCNHSKVIEGSSNDKYHYDVCLVCDSILSLEKHDFNDEYCTSCYYSPKSLLTHNIETCEDTSIDIYINPLNDKMSEIIFNGFSYYDEIITMINNEEVLLNVYKCDVDDCGLFIAYSEKSNILVDESICLYRNIETYYIFEGELANLICEPLEVLSPVYLNHNYEVVNVEDSGECLENLTYECSECGSTYKKEQYNHDFEIISKEEYPSGFEFHGMCNISCKNCSNTFSGSYILEDVDEDQHKYHIYYTAEYEDGSSETLEASIIEEHNFVDDVCDLCNHERSSFKVLRHDFCDHEIYLTYDEDGVCISIEYSSHFEYNYDRFGNECSECGLLIMQNGNTFEPKNECVEYAIYYYRLYMGEEEIDVIGLYIINEYHDYVRIVGEKDENCNAIVTYDCSRCDKSYQNQEVVHDYILDGKWNSSLQRYVGTVTCECGLHIENARWVFANIGEYTYHFLHIFYEDENNQEQEVVVNLEHELDDSGYCHICGHRQPK